MNITYVLPDTSLWGGIKIPLEQASRLHKRGHRVRVIAVKDKPDWFKIDFEFISVPKLTPRVIPQDSELIIGTFYPTVVVAHDAGFGIPIHYCQGYEYFGTDDPRAKNYIDFVYSLYTVKVVNNLFLKKILEEKYHHPTYMIHNAIDLSLFHPENRATFPKKRVLIVGPIEVEWKDIRTALKAAKILKTKLGNAVEIIRVSQFPISQEEQFLGVVDEYYNHLSGEEMAKVYSSCDVLMASSKGKEEGFGLPPIEAMACGTPVVLTDISAYRSYDEVTDYALFVPPQDPETMAQAVIHLLEDKDLYTRLQKRGLEVAKKYNWDIVENEVEAVFSEIKANHWEEFKLKSERMFPGKSDSLTEAMHFQRYRFASQFVKDKVVLDAGCGAGYGSWIMATEGGAREVIGIDYAREIIEYDLEKYQKDNLTFETMNVLDLAFEDNKFDVVVCFEVFEHIDDPDVLLKELSRVLKPDGMLIVSTPNKTVYSPDKEPGNPFHVREYSYQEFRSILAKYFHNFKFIGQYLSSGKLELRTDNGVLIERALAFIAIVQNPLKRKELYLSEGKSLIYYSYSRPEIQALIPSSAKKILDIGCGAGELGKALKERQDCEVTGIEIVPEVADKAREKLDKVIVGDIEEIIDDLPENYYDVVIFADVLEHLKNPWKILSQIKTRINAQGIVIISVPNVRHWSVIKDLLEGRWDYQEAGILDKTHLRFFTKKTILDMLDKTGFKATNLQGTILQGAEVPPGFLHALKTSGMKLFTLEEEGRIYQYLLVAQPKEVTPKTLSLTSIVILTRNNLEYTKMCLESIRRYTP
ncbi:MAG TPA: methyltransferase domain-containing protein, partial [Candidatus Atribacteria bacterium]|nr:methyltransferase domain-containing protein [Candidatus Atribacteria bacterium]